MMLLCLAAAAIDGDTISCHRHDGSHYLARLAAIDAPELPGHCRKGRNCAPGDPWAAWFYLQALLNSRDLHVRVVDADPRRRGFQSRDPYGRPIVRVKINGHDLSEMMLASGLVRKWP